MEMCSMDDILNGHPRTKTTWQKDNEILEIYFYPHCEWGICVLECEIPVKISKYELMNYGYRKIDDLLF